MLLCLIRMLRNLGFNISWKKVVGPTQRITFLGVDMDTRDSTLSLGEEKLTILQQIGLLQRQAACEQTTIAKLGLVP